MIRFFLLRFSETYFRHRWLYLIPTILMAVAAVVSIATEKPKYIAHGSIYVQKESYLASLTSVRNNDTSIWLTAAQATANEVNVLIQTDAFVRAVIHNTDLEAKLSLPETDIEELLAKTRGSIWASIQGDNQVQINAAMEKPEIAVQAVNAIIDRYIQWRINGQRAESESAQAFFNEQINQYQAELDNARQRMENYILANPAPIQGERPEIEQMEIARLQKDIDLVESRLVAALDKEENARLSLAQLESDTRQSYTIIDAPRLPDKPEISKRQLAVRSAVFLVIGVVVDVAAVVGGMLLDRSFHLPIDIPFSLNLPVLSVVPDINKKKNSRIKKDEKPASFPTLADQNLALAGPVESINDIPLNNQTSKAVPEKVNYGKERAKNKKQAR